VLNRTIPANNNLKIINTIKLAATSKDRNQLTNNNQRKITKGERSQQEIK